MCRQQSITIPREAAGKLRQEFRFQSDEWQSSYGPLRNTIEGFNGLAKDGAYEALADADGIERTPPKRRQKTTQALAQSHSASLKNAGPAP